MDTRLLEACSRLKEASACELERLLEGLFKNPRMLSDTMAEAPVIGTPYIVPLGHAHFLPVICRALVAAAQFRRDAPGWPALPLREDEIEAFVNADDVRLNILGLFGDSQRGES